MTISLSNTLSSPKPRPQQQLKRCALVFPFYVFAEVPSNMAMKRFRPSVWLPIIMIAWSLCKCPILMDLLNFFSSASRDAELGFAKSSRAGGKNCTLQTRCSYLLGTVLNKVSSRHNVDGDCQGLPRTAGGESIPGSRGRRSISWRNLLVSEGHHKVLYESVKVSELMICALSITMWYRRHECGLRMSIFFSAATAAGAFGGLLARGIMEMRGIAGLSGWQWIFILEGILTFIIG